MSETRWIGPQVVTLWDLTTGLCMARVAQDPGPNEYVFDGEAFIFSAQDANHRIGFAPPMSVNEMLGLA